MKTRVILQRISLETSNSIRKKELVRPNQEKDEKCQMFLNIKLGERCISKSKGKNMLINPLHLMIT